MAPSAAHKVLVNVPCLQVHSLNISPLLVSCYLPCAWYLAPLRPFVKHVLYISLASNLFRGDVTCPVWALDSGPIPTSAGACRRSGGPGWIRPLSALLSPPAGLRRWLTYSADKAGTYQLHLVIPNGIYCVVGH